MTAYPRVVAPEMVFKYFLSVAVGAGTPIISQVSPECPGGYIVMVIHVGDVTEGGKEIGTEGVTKGGSEGMGTVVRTGIGAGGVGKRHSKDSVDESEADEGVDGAGKVDEVASEVDEVAGSVDEVAGLVHEVSDGDGGGSRGASPGAASQSRFTFVSWTSILVPKSRGCKITLPPRHVELPSMQHDRLIAAMPLAKLTEASVLPL